MLIEPGALAGQTLEGVSAAWHEYEGERTPEPVPVWLHLSDLGAVQLGTLGLLVISSSPVYKSADMEEYGQVVVEQTGPAVLSERVGERIESVSELWQSPPGETVGVVLHFKGAAVGIAGLCDELVVSEWPSPTWSLQGVTVI